MIKENKKGEVVCIIGLGYVGWPLLKEFEKHFSVIGFDVNIQKINRLKMEVSLAEITSDPTAIKKADIVIIAVPTPIKKSKQPDLSYVISAAEIVGRNLKKQAIVVLESTVYPGVTEDIVGPILEKESGLSLGSEVFIGYSPERVNPGDTEHTIDRIVKVISGMDERTTKRLAAIYGKITTVHIAKDIKTAEAAKVIENVQRDLNIALINELALIFNKLELDTKMVLDAAATKWNFIRFSPGLVGGHCIPVDPYYLVFKAQEMGYHPQVMLAGRSVNDYMPLHVAHLAIKAINDVGKTINGSKVLLMGLTFKENVDDTRETPVKEIINELTSFKCEIFAYDPLLSTKEIESFGIKAVNSYKEIAVDCVIITVVHDEFRLISLEQLKASMNDKPILVDVRGYFRNASDHGFKYYTL